VQVGKMQSIEEAIAALGSQAPPVPAAKASPAREAAVAAPSVLLPKQAGPRPQPLVKAVAPAPTAPVPEAAPLSTTTGDVKTDLYNALVKAGLNFTADAVQQAEVSLGNSEMLIRAPKALLLSLKEPKLQAIASEVAGKRVQIRTEASANAAVAVSTPKPAGTAENSDVRERALSHPGVKRFQELFPDAQVRTVRNLNE